MNIAMTTLSSKILSQDKEYFAELAVDAVLRLKVKMVGGKLVNNLWDVASSLVHNYLFILLHSVGETFI